MLVNSCQVIVNGKQPSRKKGSPQTKFVDNSYATTIPSTGTILAGMCPIAQGVTVSQRTGDVVYWKKAYINYAVDAINSDVLSNSRVIIFQWHPNSALAAPTVNDVLQTASVYSMYDWQFSNQYTILYDKVHFCSGITSAPTVGGNQGYFGEIHLDPAAKRAEYSAALATGSEQFYILIISDSVIAPFPNFTATTRVTYCEE